MTNPVAILDQTRNLSTDRLLAQYGSTTLLAQHRGCIAHFRPVRQRVMNFTRHQMLATLQNDRFPDGTWWALG